ncbi:MAG TPA: hypothetical protein PLR06_01210 [Cyclobacteriaceae bacterium]|nr:hypothetical protein [Cyclobacteriaceae bacterium]
MTMTFEEMQERWNAIEVKPVSQEDLLKMTYASHLPRIQKMRRRLFLESVFSIVFGALVMVMLDLFAYGPLWITFAFIAGVVLYIFSNFLGYHYLVVLPQRASIRLSLVEFTSRMKSMEILSSVSGIFMSLVSILIMEFRGGNLLMWSFVLLVLLTATGLSTRKWSRQLNETRDILKGFDD